MKKNLSLYEKGHLVCAFIRLFRYQTDTPPTLSDMTEALQSSTDALSHICRQLTEAGIILPIENPFGTRYDLDNVEGLEQLPKTEEDLTDAMQEALAQFQKERSELTQKTMASVKAHQQKKEALFEELSKKLKSSS